MKCSDPEFSTRTLAAQAQISNGYISTILNTTQDISERAIEKIMPYLGLSETEAQCFRLLCKVTDSVDSDERIASLEKLQKYRRYSSLNPQETKVFNYFTKWYFIAIREMANMSSFRPDPKWIHEQLNFAVPLSEVVEALRFLIENRLIVFNNNGSFASAPDRIECDGKIYRFILTHYHKQFFELAVRSIDNTERENRNILGHTVCMSDEQFREAKQVLDDALEKIAAITNQETEASKTVYHFNLVAFPLTKARGEKS
jgi:uncharacterized protein (TIGR02147 family)